MKNSEKENRKSPQILSLERHFIVSTVITAVLLIVAAVFATLLSYESRMSYDMTSGGIFTLSEGTHDVIDSLEQNVKIGAVYASGKEETMVKSLLNRYAAASDKIAVEFIDAQAYPSLLADYNIGEAKTVANGTIIINSGSRYQLLHDDDMFTYGNNGNVFFGEQDITGAIRYVTTNDLPVIYILSGHGETSFNDLSEAVSLLGNEAYDVRQLVLLQKDIPEDADLLIMPSPATDITEYEYELFSDYLRNGGRFLLMVDPFLTAETADFVYLNELVRQYGIDITNNYVIEEDNAYYLGTSSMYLIPRYGEHEIVNKLAKSEKLVVLPISRGLGAVDYDENNVSRTALLATSPKARARFDTSSSAKEVIDTDVCGSMVLGYAATRNSGKVGTDQSRIVVIGDGTFALSSNVTAQGNGDLLIGAVNWLRGTKVSVAVPGKVINSNTMVVRGNDFARLTVLCCVVLPLIMFICAGLIWYRRRNK